MQRKDSTQKLARHRLRVLQLAEKLGNVSEACERLYIDRTSFYKWKRRYEEQGFEGLKNQSLSHRHPFSTPQVLVEKIIDFVMQHPKSGCETISQLLMSEGTHLSATTIQHILNNNRLGTKRDRYLKLEQISMEKRVVLSAEQISFIEIFNPSFRERDRKSSCPGELLVQDTIRFRAPLAMRSVYLQAVVDTFNGHAFGRVHENKSSQDAIAIISDIVAPQYKEWRAKIKSIITDLGREYWDEIPSPFQFFLFSNDIWHQTINKRVNDNGYMVQFKQALRKDFFQRRSMLSSKHIQKELMRWLAEYNLKQSKSIIVL